MKGRALILIFLFLIFITSVGAETGTYELNYDINSLSSQQDYGNAGVFGPYNPGAWIVNDVEVMESLSFLECDVSMSQWYGSTETSSFDWLSLYSDSAHTNFIGTGVYGFIKSPATDSVRIQLHIGTNLDWGGLTGQQIIYIQESTTLEDITVKYLNGNMPPSQCVHITRHNQPDGTIGTVNSGTKANNTAVFSYTFTNPYEYTYDDEMGCLNYTLYRNSSYPSKLYINNSNTTIKNETSVKSDTFQTYSFQLDYPVWDTIVTTENSNVIPIEIDFSALSNFPGPGDHIGVIEFNKSFYTDPEDIEVDWSIDNYNSDSYVYEIQMITSVSGEPSQDSWPADGNWNTSSFISSASGAAVFDFYSDGYDLPIWIQAELWAQDKTTGTWTKLDNTPVVIYHEAALDSGQIWTDKSNYNVTELVEISYTTNVTDNYIAVEEPYSIWSTHNVPVGTYSFLYELAISAVGNTDIYLFENGELVDQVTISASSESGDDAYVAWMKDYYYTGEIANFYYYSSNSSAQITVYDGADVVVFGPATTQLGYHNGMVNTANTNPGTFLVSLYHNGTYYNDTMIFESVDSWVRFDSSKYYVGGTINIEYYLSDPTQQISMWDANQKKVVRFTSDFGLISGSMQTLPYTLSEYNEYSHDIPGRLASGELTLGFWKIFIEDKNGVFVGDSWDETYVCNATDDDDGSYGFDTSNDMISIFFSLEGIFLLFTAALTVLGLAVAKHPGGGAACAVVGVGFGVYFKALPPWMLLLMVITLVVLAGVNVAVYFKGK